MKKHTVTRIMLGALCIGAVALTAGCKGQTTYLAPESSAEPASPVSSAAEQSSAASAPAEVSSPEQSAVPEQSSEQQQSSEQPQSSAEPESAPKSSAPAESSYSSESDGATVPSAIPMSVDDIPSGQRNLVRNKTLSMASSGMVKDATPTASPKFTSKMEEKLSGDEARLLGTVYTDYGEYAFSLAEQQRSAGTVYIRVLYDNPDATYEECFLEKDGSTYKLDESIKMYFPAAETDIYSGPYKTVTSLAESFPELIESGSCTIDNNEAEYEMYKGTGETLITYWSGDRFLKGEIYSGDTLAGLAYFDFSRLVSASLTSIPADYKEG